LLVCSADFDMDEGFGPDIKLARPQTIVQAARPSPPTSLQFPTSFPGAGRRAKTPKNRSL
jgi:hypothetical protein